MLDEVSVAAPTLDVAWAWSSADARSFELLRGRLRPTRPGLTMPGRQRVRSSAVSFGAVVLVALSTIGVFARIAHG